MATDVDDFFASLELWGEECRALRPRQERARQWRFTSVDEIEQHAETIVTYLREAMGHVDAGTVCGKSARMPRCDGSHSR